MSSNEESKTLAGHPPAVKVGGMRVAQNKHPSHPTEKLTKEELEEYAEPSSPPKQSVVVSGVVAKGDKDFTPEAAQAGHIKPIPQHDKRPAGHVTHIQQPRK